MLSGCAMQRYSMKRTPWIKASPHVGSEQLLLSSSVLLTSLMDLPLQSASPLLIRQQTWLVTISLLTLKYHLLLWQFLLFKHFLCTPYYRVFFFFTKKLTSVRLRVSRTIYVNVDSPKGNIQKIKQVFFVAFDTKGAGGSARVKKWHKGFLK